jgi:hypothetical protein
MKRKLIIFGNGLGMALDHVHFSLAAALADIWNRPNFLTEAQKQLIERCTHHQGPPEGEHELDNLHQAITYCKALSGIGCGHIHWLTEDGLNFPETTATYIHKVATKLHNFEGSIPENFERNLVDFIKQTQSHVATLNYDRLLYDSFIKHEIVNGYSGFLIDGVLSKGFSASALERKFGNNFGYYLHLHGSPLFIDDGEKIKKLSRHALTIEKNISSQHIVLTHISRKPAVIAASHMLLTYWEYLQLALLEAKEVILLGYSGLDQHLNSVIRPYSKNSKPLRVIEWIGAGSQRERETYWRTKFGENVVVTQFCNITQFNDW